MARYLAIDWDHNHICVIAATVSKGGVRTQRAVIFPESTSLGSLEAEAVGARLREHLKAARIGPAPVLASLGRERVVIKDIRYPAVPDHEEPAVVRFQALKELTHTPEEVVIDYTRLGESGGERRAVVLAARREHLAALQGLCRGAGLKLVAVTARPFGIAACLDRVAGTSVLTPLPDPPGSAVATVAVGEGWAEFCVSRSGVPLLTRSLTAGPNLAAEVKRSLTVYAGQAAQQPVCAVYVAGGPENAALRERLRSMVDVPVHVLDPFAGSEEPDLPVPEKRGGFAGLMGLLHLQSDRRGLPCNFLHPKQPRPPANPSKRKFSAVLAAVAMLLLALGAFGYYKIAQLSKEVAVRVNRNADMDKAVAALEDDAKRIKLVGDWNDQSVVWLHVFYDLVDAFPDPDRDRVRLSQLTATVIERPPNSKSPYVGRISIKGVSGDDHRPTNEFVDRLVGDGHYQVDTALFSSNRGPDVRNGFTQQFDIKRIDVQNLPPEKYVRRIAAEDEKNDNRGRMGRRGR